jgi:uncharacterized protein (TIGR03435 family)
MENCVRARHRTSALAFLRLACALMLCSAVRGQTSGASVAAPVAPATTYEIISIKLNKSENPNGYARITEDGFRDENVEFDTEVYDAYDLLPTQVVGMPEWADSEKYDVEARVDADTAEAWEKLTWKERGKLEQPMLRAMLADRCKFQAHFETRELPVYDLVIAKGGLKMKEAAPGEVGNESLSSNGELKAHAMEIEVIVSAFSGTDGRLVIDKTGLGDKKFDIELKWTPDNRRAADPENAGPSAFAALEEQLGLKLVSAREPVKVLVIDHMERPSPN